MWAKTVFFFLKIVFIFTWHMKKKRFPLKMFLFPLGWTTGKKYKTFLEPRKKKSFSRVEQIEQKYFSLVRQSEWKIVCFLLWTFFSLPYMNTWTVRGKKKCHTVSVISSNLLFEVEPIIYNRLMEFHNKTSTELFTRCKLKLFWQDLVESWEYTLKSKNKLKPSGQQTLWYVW